MIFDIGANIGRWAQANRNSTDKIISVEASPSTYQQLLQNCGADPKIVCVNYAACDNSGQDITFYHCTSANTISTLNKDWLASPISRFYNEPYTAITCKTITIDHLIQTYGIPDLIKVDVEGGEYECIKSLTQKVSLLCFEWASETNDVTFKTLDHLLSLGFTEFHLQYMDNYTFRPTTYTNCETVREQLRNTTPKNEWGMVWCRPPPSL
jgi:FkbM family methyltransferase